MFIILQVIRILPYFFFHGSVVEIVTPNDNKQLVLELEEAVRFRVPDRNTIITFNYKERKVSHPVGQLLEHPNINFSPLPLRIYFSVNYLEDDNDKHTQILGHRGCGSDEYRKKNKLPYITENSIASFKQAYELGANWVETDVSITSDDVIVVYHDFKVGDSPVWNMTEEQFLSRVKSPTTLEDVFKKLNPEIGLLVEVKYPSKEEIDSQKLSAVPNIEHFANKIVEVVRKKENRAVIISSFEPDIAAYIKKTSPDLEVFMNTEGVPNKFSDQRRNSLEDGIQFSIKRDFQGIITDSETVTSDPDNYTKLAHSSGLDLILYIHRSYSKETDFAKEYEKFDCAGVDGLIVDDISLLVRVISNSSCSQTT